jgi:hypothetical protein
MSRNQDPTALKEKTSRSIAGEEPEDRVAEDGIDCRIVERQSSTDVEAEYVPGPVETELLAGHDADLVQDLLDVHMLLKERPERLVDAGPTVHRMNTATDIETGS